MRSAATARATSRSATALIVKSSTYGSGKLLGSNGRLGEITRRPLCRHFDAGVVGNEVLGNRHSLSDLYALTNNGFELHVAHGYEAIDAADSEPVEGVRHKLLEPHVLSAGDALGAFEISLRPITPLLPFSRVVYEKLCHLAQRASFLAVINDDPGAALLRRLDANLDAVGQVGPAGADVGTEYV